MLLAYLGGPGVSSPEGGKHLGGSAGSFYSIHGIAV